MDFTNNHLAATGDELHITVADPEGNALGEVTHALTTDEVDAKKAEINVTLNPRLGPWDVNQDGKIDISELYYWWKVKPHDLYDRYGNRTSY